MDLQGKLRRITHGVRIGLLGMFAAVGLAFVYAGILPTGETVPVGSKTTPFTLSVISSPSLPPEVQAQEAASAPNLFDRDTTSEHAVFAQSQLQAAFASPEGVNAIKIYGAAPYHLTVQAESAGGYQNIAGLENLDLTLLPTGWTTFKAATAVTTGKLQFVLTPATGGTATGLRELEIWTTAAPVTVKNGAALLEKLLGPTPPPQGRVYNALNPTANPTVGVITPNDAGGDLADNKFSFTLESTPAPFVRAYLTYELFGQAHFVSARRNINGINSNAGGGLILPTATWSTQVERINPAWLKLGANTIEFTVLSSSFKDAGYTVRNVRVIGELDTGANSIETVTASTPDEAHTNPVDALYDGDLATGWKPYPQDQPINADIPVLEFSLRRPTQMDAVSFYLSAPIQGQLQIATKQAGQWTALSSEGMDLHTGWNTLSLPESTPPEQRIVDGVKLTFPEGLPNHAEIREILFTGSGVGTRTSPPKITIAYPDAGQFHARRAYVQGFIEPWNNGSGLAKITLGGLTVSHFAGTIGHWIGKNDVGLLTQADNDPWSAELKVVYPNGETVSTIIPFTQQMSDAVPAGGPVAGGVSGTVSNKTKKTLSNDESTLVFEAGSVAGDTLVTITPLEDDKVPALDVGMTNVTKGPRRGYRFTPHGAKFLKNVALALPYDKALIPPGQTEDNVKTFYFDDQAGRWIELTRVSVDKTAKVINSVTNHFTDMINATITVPDHPNPTSFNPTSMKDIKAADPGAQVNLIEAPKVNNMGDARLSYPIEVPPGRQGMQPSLSINYNSSGGNGWLGVGWELSTPSISIDTRFGVPKYNETQREETYLFNGQQLVKLPNGEYRQRIEGAFNRIVRHGTNPANYWWVVTDKNGTRSIFGGDETAQLRSQDRVFTWHLNRTINANGNTVDYLYEPKLQPVHNGGEPATYSYLKEIRYTGFVGAGKSDDVVRNVTAASGNYYRVSFLQDPVRRDDAVVDGRPGFKTVLDERLKTIQVDLVQGAGVSNIRSYVLNYKRGDFDKTLLESIVQKGVNGKDFAGNRHAFDYFTMPKTNEDYDAFAPVENWTVPAIPGGLSLTKNNDKYAGIFLGIMVFTDALHIGAGWGAGDGKSKTELSTVDLNGDGLSDFLQPGSTFYKNQWSHAANDGKNFTATGANGSVDSLGFEENKVRSRDLGIHIGDHSQGAKYKITLTRGKSTTVVTGSKMLSDINGDGLVDQLSVAGGGLTVRLNNGNGFDAPINWAGGVNITPPLTATERQQLLNDYPSTDPVRAWKAPFTGSINITGTVAKLLAADPNKGEDGVRVAVFKGTATAPLWEKIFTLAESLDLSSIPELQNLSVTRGEFLYIKLNAIEDSDRDTLNTDITAAYSAITYTDADGVLRTFTAINDPRFDQTPLGYPQFASNSQTGFALATLALKPDAPPPHPLASPSNPQPAPPLKLNTTGEWKAPYKGKIRLTNAITRQVVSEDLRFRVVKQDEDTGMVTTLLDKFAAANDTSAINDVLENLDVTEHTKLVFEISLPKLGAVRADRLNWTPEVRYVHVCSRRRLGQNIDDPSTLTPADGQSPGEFLNEEVCTDLTLEEQERTDRDLPGAVDPQDGTSPIKLFVFKPTPILNLYPFARSQPLEAWVAPRDGVVRIVAKAFKNVKTSSDIHLKVQSTNQLLAQHTLAADFLQPDTQVIAVDVQVQAGQRLFFNVHSQEPIPKTVTVFSGPDDTVGQEVTVFGWTPEILYVDPQHCYIDAQTGLEKCVPVSTNYVTPTQWNMHFDQLCLAQDRCVVVDCTGTRTPGVPSARTADACVTTEPDPNSPPDTTPPQTIRVTLTAAERAAFNLNREQYFVPVTNRDHLDWSLYESQTQRSPVRGYYRDWAYVYWNGNFAWDPSRLVVPETIDTPADPNNPTQEEADRVEVPYFWMATPLAFGNSHHDGVPIWSGPGVDDFISLGEMQPSRVGGNITPFINVPQGAGISLLRRTLNEQTKTALGAGPLGASKNEGPAKTSVDLIDLNGDRYPDQVADNSVVFNHGTPGSGFDTGATGVDFSINGESTVRRTDSKSVGLSFGTGFLFPSTSSSGVVNKMKTLAPSIGTGYGSSKTLVDFIDINGDGLPDRVHRDGANVLVRLNLGGDRFGAQENWTAPAWTVGNISRLDKLGPVSPNFVRVTDTVNASVSGGGGGEFGGGSFGASASFAASGARTIVDFTDINGDGLPDLVMKEHGTPYFLVRINRGNDFDPLEKKWIVPGWGGVSIGRGATAALYGGNDVLGYNESWTLTGGLNAVFHIDFTIWVIQFHLFIEPDANISTGEGNSSLAVMDIDGDGAPDQVYRSASATPGGAGSTEVKVKRSKVGKTNLLKFVSRPLGGSFDLDYLREGNFVDRSDPNNIIEMNTSKWVMSKVIVHDGQGNSYPTQYKHFTSGFYHRGERENFGFSHCQEIRADGATTDYFYHNQDYTKKGLLFRKIYRDKFGALFTREENSYDVFTLQLPQGARPAVRFPAPSRKESHFYEGTQSLIGDIAVTATPAPGVKRQAESYTYETAFGNVVALTDFGDFDSATDDLQATIDYFTDPAAYIVKPSRIIASSGASLLRQRDANYAPGTGNLTQVRQADGRGQTAVTDLAYFSNGNLQTVTGPANQLNQRYTLNYEYDPALDTHVKRVSDNFLLSSQATYNLLFGKIATSLDTNGNTTTTNYDDFGRVSSIIGPYEQTTGNITLQFDYHPEGSLGCAAPGAAGCAGTVPYALTQHLDLDALGNTKDPIDTVLFTDGLKRVLQTKKDATVLEGNAPLDRMIVSGRTVFDEVGRIIKQFYPTVEPLGQGATFNTAFDLSAPPTVMDYDVLDRNTRTTLPDSSFTTMAYGFGPDRGGTNQFETIVADNNVNALLKGAVKRTYRDVNQLITSVKESNNLQTIWTSYDYDAVKQITKVVDDKGNTTAISYDNLGRRTVIDNPDTGRTETQYDTAGNVIKKITANLKAQLKSIDYAYDFNRLSSITYPNFPDNNVAYTYGAPGAPNNAAGRITKVISHNTVTSQGTFQDTEERQYGKLGETVYEKKTVVTFTNTAHPSVFETHFKFDTFGRLLRLTYPDGEILTNEYDSGGNLKSTKGEKNGFKYTYLKQLSYDRFEQRVLLEAGNSVKTAYTYDAATRRLNTLTSGKGNGNLFQNLNYSYDKVGNVLGLQNQVDIPPASSYGGPTTQTFTYDELYRLTHAEGTFKTSPNKTHTYALDMAYDTIHNIVTKHQLHTIVQPSLQAITQKKTSYDFSYQYSLSGPTSVRPHAPTHIGDRTYNYDANGNQTGWTQDTNGTNRTIIWNEENRIESISDQGHTKTYKYDDEGTRVIKRGPQGETVYVNQFYTQRPGATGTKHVFAGTSRIVSKLVKQDTPGANPQGNTPFEKDLYFYHPDHLGTSNYITDTNGKLYEHLEYFPFGESWVEENSNTQRTPFLFTAKELDEETGLYAFGARYYDPRTSVWQSPDPILGKYLPDDEAAAHLPGFGGIYNARNLGLYSYTHLNPVTYHDPDGNVVKLLVTIVKIGIKGGDIYSTVSGIVDNAKVLMDPNASAAEKLMAAADIALDVGTGINTRDIKAAARAVENVKDRVQAARAANKACSFAAGTLVMTKEGLKPIEDIKAGDYVLARNDLTGEQSWRRVVLAYNSLHNDILSLSLMDSQSGESENVVTTSEHPFYLKGQGWMRADQLNVGDLIETADAKVVRVASVEWLRTEQLAYNMEVEEFHTYFVGQKQVWVHNSCSYPRNVVDEKKLLATDKTGKVHTKEGHYNELPGWKDVQKMGVEDLKTNVDALKKSLKTRIDEQKRLGTEYKHSTRIADEQKSLRLHEKRLEDLVGKKNVSD